MAISTQEKNINEAEAKIRKMESDLKTADPKKIKALTEKIEEGKKAVNKYKAATSKANTSEGKARETKEEKAKRIETDAIIQAKRKGKTIIHNPGARVSLGGFVFSGINDPDKGKNILSVYELNAVLSRLRLNAADEIRDLLSTPKERVAVVGDTWTEPELVEYLSENGFKALRALADEYGIKGRRKTDLIASLNGKRKEK